MQIKMHQYNRNVTKRCIISGGLLQQNNNNNKKKIITIYCSVSNKERFFIYNICITLSDLTKKIK